MREINLLPKPRQQELYNQSILRSLIKVVWISVSSFLLILLLQFGTKFYLQKQLQVTLNRIELLKSQVNKQENAEIKQKIKVINNQILDFKSLAENTVKWSKVIEAFALLPPEEIKINSFSIDMAKKTITITGFSPTRELVIQLHDNIQQDSKHFYNIDFPLENIVRAKDISFHYSFNIQNEFLK